MKGIRMGRGVLALCTVMLISINGSVSFAGPAEQLPNLTLRAPYEIKIGEADESSPLDPSVALRFSVGTVNAGEYPLEVLGIRHGLEQASARQCTAWVDTEVCSKYIPAGTFSYHEHHAHFHYDDFAQYELRRVLPDGTPDFESPIVAGGDKASFCLSDVEKEGESSPLRAVTGRYSPYVCHGVLQGISQGWVDVYHSGLWGQQIVIDDVPNGTYALVVILNPLGRLKETNLNDNMAFTVVTIAR